MRTLTIALLAMLLTRGPLGAQTDFYGALDDVHPLRLTLPDDGPRARLWIGSATVEIALEGWCEAGTCAYDAIDTALALRFFRTADERLIGTATAGDGRPRALEAHAYAGPSVALELATEAPPAQRSVVPAAFANLLPARLRAPRAARADSMLAAFSEEVFAPDFLQRCGSDKWVSAYSTAGAEHRLTLATLPGQRVLGSLYLASVHTTLLVQGEREGRAIHLAVARPDGTPAGELRLAADSTSVDWERASATLDLGGGPQALRLAVVERVPLGCRQADGRFDLVMPLADVSAPLPSTPEATTERDLPQLGWTAWTAMRQGDAQSGQGWFEPLRLDGDVLSGWLHVQTPGAFATYPVNLNRRTGYLLGDALLSAGPARPRRRELSRHLRTAVAAHPLRDDPRFRDWMDGEAFAETAAAVTAEGLAYATARHPVYGRLVYVEPWGELPAELAAAVAFLDTHPRPLPPPAPAERE